MTERERFLATLKGEETDRSPIFDLEPSDETVESWRRDGLPRGQSAAKFFHLETHHPVGVKVRSAPFYSMATDLLDTPEAFHRHYNLGDPDRFPKRWMQRCSRARREGRVVYVDASGGGLFQMLGVGDWDSLVAACAALVERPQDVDELLERTADFHCACLDRVLSQVSIDYASFYEPIATNTGTLISPEMFQRFAVPVYRKVLNLLQEYRVPFRIMCTTGGDLSSLLPSLIDIGINGLWISNIMSAHMEYSALRRDYGADIALIGGIDSTALIEGEDAVRRILEETVPPLLKSGRYLPCLDDRPRSNVSFAQYKLYRDLLNQMG